MTGSDDDSIERRYDGADRRAQPTRMLSRHTLKGRRRGGRRAGEVEAVYVDRPGGWIVLAFTAVMGLSLLDAWFTLTLIKNGATEANPIMCAFLELGDRAFVVLKTLMTLLAVGFLCLHKNWPLGRLCLGISLAGYSVLTVYHLYAQAVVRGL